MGVALYRRKTNKMGFTGWFCGYMLIDYTLKNNDESETNITVLKAKGT
jgi:hypothetical protein